MQTGNIESDADSTSIPLSLRRTRRTNRRLPARYRDMLPEPCMPLPPPEFEPSPGKETHLPELAITSMFEDVQAEPRCLLSTKTFKTQANSYGLFRVYNHDTLPVIDPEDTSGSVDHININSDANPFHPYPNKSSLLLGDWYWNQGAMKSKKGFRNLLKIMGSSEFSSEDIRGTEWTKVDRELGNLVASDESTPMPGSSLEWLNNDAGWKGASVMISIPFPRRSAHPSPAAYLVRNFYHRSLVAVIREKVCDPRSHHAFHYEPYALHWHPPHKTREIGVHGELFTSESFVNAHNQLQNSPPEPGCDLPRRIVALMFWSDATQLTAFGDAKLWPLYMYFGNESKYTRCQPSAHLCNHIAYFQTVCHYCTGRRLTDILLSFLMISKTLCTIASRISGLVMLSSHTVIGNSFIANGKSSSMKSSFVRTSMVLLLRAQMPFRGDCFPISSRTRLTTQRSKCFP